LHKPIALGQEIGAADGQWGTGRLGSRAQGLQRPSKPEQIAIPGEPAAIRMAKQALQKHPLLLLPPAQLAQKQIKLGKIRTPVLRILSPVLGLRPGSGSGRGWRSFRREIRPGFRCLRHWRHGGWIWRAGPCGPWQARLKMLVQAPSRPIFCFLCTGCLTQGRTHKAISLKSLDEDHALAGIRMDKANPKIHGACRWE